MRQPRPVHQIKDQQDLRRVRDDDPNFSGTLAKGLMILQSFVKDPRAHANSEFAERLRSTWEMRALGVLAEGVASNIRYGPRKLLFNCAVPGYRAKPSDLLETIGPTLVQPGLR